MISEAAMRRALNRLALLKFFPSGNAEAVAFVAGMIRELYTEDADVDKAVSNILHDPNWSEWPGAGAFFDVLKRAIYPHGMWKRDGKWVPSPENAIEFDIVGPDGARHWVNGIYYPYPEKPWDKSSNGGENEAAE
jgi:hypothetical protein